MTSDLLNKSTTGFFLLICQFHNNSKYEKYPHFCVDTMFTSSLQGVYKASSDLKKPLTSTRNTKVLPLYFNSIYKGWTKSTFPILRYGVCMLSINTAHSSTHHCDCTDSFCVLQEIITLSFLNYLTCGFQVKYPYKKGLMGTPYKQIRSMCPRIYLKRKSSLHIEYMNGTIDRVKLPMQ